MYVIELKEELQREVLKRVIIALEELGLEGEELAYHTQRALDSKIHNLDETIEIHDILEAQKA